MTQKFLDSLTFQKAIEAIVKEKRVDYVDAILIYCKQNDLEPEDISKLVSSNLKHKLRASAQAQGLMKKESTLPI
jgi:hypothetical protein